jgi:hypothetical protein
MSVRCSGARAVANRHLDMDTLLSSSDGVFCSHSLLVHGEIVFLCHRVVAAEHCADMVEPLGGTASRSQARACLQLCVDCGGGCRRWPPGERVPKTVSRVDPLADFEQTPARQSSSSTAANSSGFSVTAFIAESERALAQYRRGNDVYGVDFSPSRKRLPSASGV